MGPKSLLFTKAWGAAVSVLPLVWVLQGDGVRDQSWSTHPSNVVRVQPESMH